MWRLVFLGLASLATAVPALADSPWRTAREQTVQVADFPETVPFEGARQGRRISVEEIDSNGDSYQLRFTLLDGPGNRAPILAYLDVTVRPGPNGNAITVDMMQSFGEPGGGTMSDLCRAVGRHPDFRRAVTLTALLDMTNDKTFKAALGEPGASPESAFRSFSLDPRAHSILVGTPVPSCPSPSTWACSSTPITGSRRSTSGKISRTRATRFG